MGVYTVEITAMTDASNATDASRIVVRVDTSDRHIRVTDLTFHPDVNAPPQVDLELLLRAVIPHEDGPTTMHPEHPAANRAACMSTRHHGRRLRTGGATRLTHDMLAPPSTTCADPPHNE